MSDGTCAQCGDAFASNPQNKSRQRFCSSRCQARSRGDHLVAAHRLCGRCGVLYPVRVQALRRGLRGGHECQPHLLRDREPICISCMVVKEPGHNNTASHKRTWHKVHYIPVAPHPIDCSQCGRPFIGLRANKCPECVARNRRRYKRQSERQRERRKRGVHTEPYRSQDVFERDGWKCHLCGRLTRRGRRAPHPLSPSIDHLVPISKGGSDTLLNVATAHFLCNAARGVGGVAQLRLVA